MFSNLFFSTLPLFGLVFIGYSLGKFSLFNDTEAKVFSKLVALVVVPGFGIKIIGNFNYEFINWKLYFSYLLAQGTIYFIAFISRIRRSLRNKNNGAENAIAIENVARVIIQKCLMFKRLDSINIHIKMALAKKSKSKEIDLSFFYKTKNNK